MRTLTAISATTATKSSLESLPPTPAMAVQQQRSPWHSPVPYLFGGLAAMLGLIAFALLILACSYWKLSSRLEDREGGERDLESGGGDEKDQGEESSKTVKVFEEKILVIMAGNENATFLATPVSLCSKVASFGADKHVVDEEGESKDGDKEESSSEKMKEELGAQHLDEAVSGIQNSDTETQQGQLEEEEEEEAHHHQNQ
ncbi:hypothetical protein GBA52_001779 [Prunus armeniaca]|nr:hypothetical protein GBA52_001779 [Prunus armeniaca]